MNTSQHTPMRKRFAFATAVVFVIGIMTTIPFNGMLASTAVAQQQQINSNTSSQTANPSNPLPLRTIFKQVENSVVQITSKTPTIGAPNSQNPQSPNATTLGSGFVYDKQGHIVTNGHVVGDAKIVDVTFVDGNRYTAIVIASDTYSDIAVLQLLSQNASQPQRQQQLLSSFKPLALGNSSNIEVGDAVIAIGNPFGLRGHPKIS